ncbi:hypothetical protein ACGGAI_26075 [Streptomyces antibioticus]|uniref:hypothetical protein n=1 Tax=Streptomyces antibioticus TaxID=1890 RepID=UPI003713F30C
MTDHLNLVTDEPAPTTGWRFSVVPPKDVWTTWFRTAKAVRRPAGSLALPAIATTATLHFTHTLHQDDTLMTLGLTALTVGYDAVIAVCRTHEKIADRQRLALPNGSRQAA